LLKIIGELGAGRVGLGQAKTYLIETKNDDFKMQSIVDNYVVYAYTNESFDTVQVALKKQTGRYYGGGERIPGGYYQITDVEEFATVFGGKRQIVVVDEVKDL
jgi:hypothetical protein